MNACTCQTNGVCLMHPRGMNEAKTYWNGEPCEVRFATVVVGKPMRPTWWCADLEGQERLALEVEYNGKKFYLDGEDKASWIKVTEGQGSPSYSHKSLPVEKVVRYE